MTWTDDPAILDSMLADWEKSGTKAEVTGSLVELYDAFAAELRTNSLRELAELRVRGLTAIGAVDDIPIQYPLLRLAATGTEFPQLGLGSSEGSAVPRDSLIEALRFAEAEPASRVLPYDLSLADLEEAAFRMCELHGRLSGAVPLAELEMGTAHGPSYTFLIEGKRYSYYYLYYYLHYAYCARFLDFREVASVIEMGPGAGRAVEVLKKAHPHLSFYLVDLAPTLYVCHQYLAALFPESLVPYAATRAESQITAPKAGSITFLQPHQLEAVTPAGPTLSFNTGVFCNMQPSTVRRYLSVLKSMVSWVYLMEPQVDETKRLYDLPDAPTFDTYRSVLQPDFHLVDRSEALMPLRVRREFGVFETTFWTRTR